MSTLSKSPRSVEEGSRLDFETMISELSSRFINLLPSDVDREIEDALRRVCEALGIDLAVLWQWSRAAPDDFAPTHVYPPQVALRPGERLCQEIFPWVVEQARAGRMVVIPAVEEMPAEAALDRENACRRGIKSNLCLPLSVGSEPPLAALSFSTLRARRDWPDELVKRLQLVGQVFANALARKHADQALRESEETSRATFDQADVGIAHVGIDGRWLRVNESLCAIVGYPREELLQLSFQDITRPEDMDASLKLKQEVLAGGIDSYSMEKRYIRKDRSVVWVNLTVSLVRTAAGEPRHFIAVVEDITERKRAEEEFRASEARLAAGADLAGLVFYEVDFDERTAFVDERFRDVGGYPAETLPGLEGVEFWLEHVHPEDRQRFLDEREQLHEGRLEQLTIEYRYLHPTRGERWMLHVARVTSRDASGRTIKTFGVIRDITERRQREEALKQSYAEIERLKDRLQAESDYLKAEIKVVYPHGEVTGESPAIQKVLRQVEQVAPTDSSVLVRGETGTGKELVAQAIHRLSSRQGHLMVKVNCAALPSGLIESELFGREKGAFTGAMTRQVGRFEVADGSTLFLDEVGELSLEVQAKLLRVLEAGEFERLGSPRTIKVDVRLVAATNRDLAEGIKKGRFREDLYYRLNVFPIRVPPLRERTEDIPLLVWTFLEEFSTRMGKKITQVPRKTMDALVRHSWPGNVRELRNVIEHAAILTTGDTLRVPLLEGAAAVAAPSPTLAASERELILRALEKRGWRVKGPTGAAAALGLNPSTLYSRMKKLGIRPPGPEEDASA
jgi:formate hydrogenlyase transcriptional activator